MPVQVHAVVYTYKGLDWLSVREWNEPQGQDGILRLDEGLRGDLAQLREVASAALDRSDPPHDFRGSDAEMTYEVQKPRLLLFRFGDDDWVARGFVPFFQSGGAGPQVRVLASAKDASETDRALRALVARYLRILATSGQARAPIFAQVPLEEVARSLAFASQAEVAANFGDSASDFGRASDG